MSAAGPAPLEGVWVVDKTEVWARPMAASILGDLGATVIKLESFPRPSLTRLRGSAIGYSDNDPSAPRPWDRAALHNMANRNKLGVTLNLKHPLGMAAFRRLVAKAGALMTSLTAGTAARLGVDYETVRGIRADIVMLSMSGWGEAGPYQGYAALGSALDGFVGHHALRGYPDTDDYTTPLIQHTDATACVTAVFALLAALFHRRRTGHGQWIDMSQVETFLPHFGGPFMDYAMNGRNPVRHGAGHPVHAPHGCYRCRGDDDWVVITVTTEAEWAALCRAACREEWLADGRFSDRAGRRANAETLDRAIEEWTRCLDKFDVMRALQEAGVPAQPVLDDADLYRDRHLAHRGYFKMLEHPSAGERRYPGFLWNFGKSRQSARLAPNALGEHNDYVFGELLGMSEGEVAALRSEGVIGESYPPGVYGAG